MPNAAGRELRTGRLGSSVGLMVDPFTLSSLVAASLVLTASSMRKVVLGSSVVVIINVAG